MGWDGFGIGALSLAAVAVLYALVRGTRGPQRVRKGDPATWWVASEAGTDRGRDGEAAPDFPNPAAASGPADGGDAEGGEGGGDGGGGGD
jgi:hypothetical protein